jgi:hypothetical protein
MSTQVYSTSGTGFGAIPGISLAGQGVTLDRDHPDLVINRGLNIRIVPANGGTIISIRNDSDFHVAVNSDLYVISEDQDLASEIGKIITLHCLKKDNK